MSLAAHAAPLSLIGWEGAFWVVSIDGWGRSEGSTHGKRVIEMESKHRGKIITCQARLVLGNELQLT